MYERLQKKLLSATEQELSLRYILILSVRGLTVLFALCVLLGMKTPWVFLDAHYLTVSIMILVSVSLLLESYDRVQAFKAFIFGIASVLFSSVVYNTAFYRLALFGLFVYALSYSYQFIFASIPSMTPRAGFVVTAAILTLWLSPLAGLSLSPFAIIKIFILSLLKW